MTYPGPVVAVVAAFEGEETVGTTVAALLSTGTVDRVIVVDDGSRDSTSVVAAEAGAEVLRLARNRGKGEALSLGIGVAPEAAIYLLVDADLGTSAALTARLLAPVVEGEAGMAVAVLPSSGRSGGFGLVRRMATWGVCRATGWRPRAPLSGQRAVDGPTLRSLLPLAAGFGLETALGIDAVRAGVRVVEAEVALEHRATGRGWAGFGHRGRQGVDVVRALSGRLGSTAGRAAAACAAVAVGVAALGGLSAWRSPSITPLGGHAGHSSHLLIFGVPGLSWDEVSSGRMPILRRLTAEGAAGSVMVDADDGARHAADGYATLGAGAPAEAGPAEARPAAEGGAALARQSGRSEAGEIAVVAAPGAQRVTRTAAHRRWVVTTSLPGSLGAALHRAGQRTGAVGAPPGALAVMDEGGWVDVGTVHRESPLEPAALAAEAGAALRRAAVVIADVGSQAGADRALAQVLPLLPADTTVVVLSPSPGSKPVPVVFWGAGVSHGRLELSGGVRLRPLTLPDVTATLMGLTGTRPSSSGTGRALGVTPVAAGGDHGLPAAFGRSAHVAGAGPSADGVVAPVVAGFLGLLGLGAAVWLVRERGWPEAPDPRRRPRVAPAMVSRWLAAGAVVAFSLPALVLAQAALAEGASAGGPPTVAGLLGLGLVAVVRALARRGMVRGVRSTVQAGGWALLAAGSLALALVPEAGRWAVVAPRSPLLGGLAGAGPAVTAAVLGGALLAAAAAGGALGRAVPLLAAGAVLAVPVLGDDPVAAGIAFLAAGIALAGHLGPGRSARRLPALVGGLAAGALAAAPALLRPGMPATLARSLGADVFGWRSPWLPAAVVGLGAAVAVATVVIPGGPGAGATKTRHEGESGAAGGERAVGWGLLLACFLAVGLHPDGMPTAALLFTQLAALAVLIALRAGEPEPALSESQTSEARLRPAPVTASRA